MAAVSADIEARVRHVENSTLTGLNRMDAHETICAERYAGILATHGELKAGISKTNSLLLRIGIALIVGMAAILAKQVFHS